MPVRNFFWLWLVIGTEVILVTLYALSVHMNGGEPAALLDVNGYRTLPSWLQTIQIFALGALPGWLAMTYRTPYRGLGVPPSRYLLMVVAVLFLYASMDELFKLNILFGQQQLWKSIYLVLGLSIPVFFFRDIVRLCRFAPKTMRLIGIGIAIFLLCGFGLDLFRVHIQQPYWYQLFGQWQFYQVDSIRTALEEFGEMLGETLILKGTVDLAQKRNRQIALSDSY
ncbi:MAG: hypothetical protein AAFQ63_04875 [Cyanobacteria bacterium J06621_11]